MSPAEAAVAELRVEWSSDVATCRCGQGSTTNVYKDPITDKGKVSKMGKLSLEKDANGNLVTGERRRRRPTTSLPNSLPTSLFPPLPNQPPNQPLPNQPLPNRPYSESVCLCPRALPRARPVRTVPPRLVACALSCLCARARLQ